MKKSLLALAIMDIVTSATAATVYDKDGTTLEVGGRVQAVGYNGNFDEAGDHDSNLKNSARLNLAGNTKNTDWVSALAFTEWEMANGHKGEDGIESREQYVGLDFGDFGQLTAGKQNDSFYDVIAPTDVFEDCGNVGTFVQDDRRNGVIKYTYDNNHFFGSASGQIAADKTTVFGEQVNVNGGFAAVVGVNFDVLGAPLAVKTGYSYLQGQNKPEDRGETTMNKYKQAGVGISYGSTDAGLYLAAQYNITKRSEFDSNVKKKNKGFEFVGGYAFENGISFLTGYLASNEKSQPNELNHICYKVRKVPVFVNYVANENFNVWAEAQFDAGSNKLAEKADMADAGTKLALGARYTF